MKKIVLFIVVFALASCASKKPVEGVTDAAVRECILLNQITQREGNVPLYATPISLRKYITDSVLNEALTNGILTADDIDHIKEALSNDDGLVKEDALYWKDRCAPHIPNLVYQLHMRNIREIRRVSKPIYFREGAWALIGMFDYSPHALYEVISIYRLNEGQWEYVESIYWVMS